MNNPRVPNGAAVILVVLLMALMALQFGCNLFNDVMNEVDDVRQTTENILDDGIRALEDASADWQQVLRDMQAQLTENAQSTIRNEIANLASRGIAQTGVELRCNADFIRDRIKQALIRIQASFLGQEVPPVEPGLCQVVPEAVERELVPGRINRLSYYGYDFDLLETLQVFHEDGAGLHNVNFAVDMPTHYALTLNLGSGGISLNDRSRRLILKWGDRLLSSVAILQPETPVCVSRVTRFRPGSITYVPPHTRGDRDFHGHGPNVFCMMTLVSSPSQLRARVYMRAKETKSDWTTASGQRMFDLYTPESGWQIDGIIGPLSSTHQYRDGDHSLDTFNLGTGGPARRFVFVGDTDGNEAGTRTKVDASFNELQIKETQIADCVPAEAVRALNTRGLLTSGALRRLEPSMRLELERIRITPP